MCDIAANQLGSIGRAVPRATTIGDMIEKRIEELNTRLERAQKFKELLDKAVCLDFDVMIVHELF